jgi:D-alanyl-D-alanine carboxypeptidase
MSENAGPKQPTKLRSSTTTRRRFIGLLTIASATAAGVETVAFGNEAGQGKTYTSQKGLDERKKTIAGILGSIPPAETAAWIVGNGKAADQIKAETDQQVANLAQAAATGTGAADPDAVVVSFVRDAASQRTIWDRKYDFRRKNDGGAGPFGLITDESRLLYGDKLGPDTQWDPDKEPHREVWASLTSDQRQTEILQTSTAPGVSRHHLGSDADLFSTTPADWTDNGPMAAQYAWLTQNAAQYGFFQPYSAQSAKNRPAISEERWHWSYYPVAEAVLDFVRANPDKIQTQLENLWSYDPSRYTYIHANWPNYMFHVSESVRFP